MIDNETNMIIAYDRILSDENERRLPNGFFRYTDENNERMAILLFKHVFEDILDWTPENVLNNASKELIDRMKLAIPYSKLRFPKELNKNMDYFYIAYLVYPEKFANAFSRKKLILNMYENILDKKESRFPKDYFQSEDGELRSKICMQRALTKEGGFRSIDEMYQKFTDTKWANAFFKKYRLDFVLEALYGKDALAYLHCSLSSNQQDPLAYTYYKFMRIFEKSKEKKLYDKIAKKSGEEDTNKQTSYDKGKFRFWYEQFMEIFEHSEASQIWAGMEENAVESLA